MIKILVVEDDDALRELWRRALQASDYEVVEATTLSAAIHALDREGPDILVLDWWLGKETATLILDRWVKEGDGPAMIVTGDHDLRVDDLYLEGAWHILYKPIGIDVFLTIVRRYGMQITVGKRLEEYKADLVKLRKAVVVLALVSLLNVANVPTVVEWLKPIWGLLW